MNFHKYIKVKNIEKEVNKILRNSKMSNSAKEVILMILELSNKKEDIYKAMMLQDSLKLTNYLEVLYDKGLISTGEYNALFYAFNQKFLSKKKDT